MNDSLTLATEIPLAANLILKKGTHVKVDTINPMDEISVQNIDVVLTPCPASLKDKKTEMTLIQELYGAELTPGCRLELFVEYTDLNRVSVFNSNPPTAKKLHDQTL